MKRYSGWGVAILAVATVASLVAAFPAEDSYCKVCTIHHRVQPYGIRFTRTELFRRSAVSPTPFSKLLDEKRVTAPHAHQWLPPQFVPDPRNEFGPAVFESLEFLNAPRVVNFMRNVADYADPVSTANWQGLMLQPHNTRVIDAALRFSHVPEAGFADRTEFLTWWGDNAYALSYRVQQLTQPD